jgi:DNA-directed RNA polymerase subunit RPC12/RpoP
MNSQPGLPELSPDEKCSRCGSLLFQPYLASGLKVPPTADYVCLNCGRAYAWAGTPPTLTVVVTARADNNDDDDDDGG